MSDLSDLNGHFTSLRIAECLVMNENLKNLDFYLHELLPCLLTCVVNKSLSKTPAEDHWALRDYAASIIAKICEKFGRFYGELQGRVLKTYQDAFIKENKPLITRYGGINGVCTLGELNVISILIPFLKSTPFLENLEKTSHGGLSSQEYFRVENDSTFVRRIEAFRVLNAIKVALLSVPDSKVKWDLLESIGYENVSEDYSLFFV